MKNRGVEIRIAIYGKKARRFVMDEESARTVAVGLIDYFLSGSNVTSASDAGEIEVREADATRKGRGKRA